MFTQCTNCQAIFRVSMREVTVSKGLLRCGECQEVFDSSKNLSTTMQKPFVDTDLENKVKTENLSEESLQTISALDDWQSSSVEDSSNLINLKKSTKNNHKPDTAKSANEKYKYDSNAFSTRGVEQVPQAQKKTSLKLWPILTVAFLSLLLISQVAYNYRHLFLDTLKYDPEKIQMLNHNVFAHPIDKGVLLISASIENIADFDQPFPILEVRLTNSKSELIALRRFKPSEYLDNFSENKLLAKHRATSIKLKIKDPGSQATRFQFDFL